VRAVLRAGRLANRDGMDECFHPSEIRIQLSSEYKDSAKVSYVRIIAAHENARSNGSKLHLCNLLCASDIRRWLSTFGSLQLLARCGLHSDIHKF
jgi:hypothetical protein